MLGSLDAVRLLDGLLASQHSGLRAFRLNQFKTKHSKLTIVFIYSDEVA